MSNTVRAKVRCVQITVGQVFGCSSVYFSTPRDLNLDSENAVSAGTLSVNAIMTVKNGARVSMPFEQGQEYYLDFTRVAAVVDPRQTSIMDGNLLVRSVIVYGPQGCGKSTNAVAIAQYLNLETVVDGWNGQTDFPNFGALILTDLPRSALTLYAGQDRRAQLMDFYDVMQNAGLQMRSATPPALVDEAGRTAADLASREPYAAGDSAENAPTKLDAGNASCGSGAQDGGSADCSSSDSGGSSGD